MGMPAPLGGGGGAIGTITCASVICAVNANNNATDLRNDFMVTSKKN